MYDVVARYVHSASLMVLVPLEVRYICMADISTCRGCKQHLACMCVARHAWIYLHLAMCRSHLTELLGCKW